MQKTRAGRVITFDVDQKKIERLKQLKSELGSKFPKFGVLILSYNASKHISKTISRIPEDLYDLISEIFVFDDCSPDNADEVARQATKTGPWKDKINIYRNPTNLRYGGNQKAGYKYAIEKNLDYVIMLHGDGQYAPEYIPDLMLPAVEDGEEVVFASRMMRKSDALKGGMPLYKFIGNQILTLFENLILGVRMTEFHSGYRMYSTKVLRRIPIQENTNEFHFDTEIIIQCRHLGVPIKEVPIKTFYGDEECNVDGMQYAFDVVKAVIIYRLHQLHIIRKGAYIFNREFSYTRKKGPYGSHELILNQMTEKGRVLELGSTTALLYRDLIQKGNDVTYVHVGSEFNTEIPNEDYIRCDIQNLEKLSFSREFDYIVLADVIEHLPNAQGLMKFLQKFLKEDGEIIVSVPNIAIFIYRLSLLIGRFNYSNKGTLDETHVRFYTKFTILQLFDRADLEVISLIPTGLPFEVIFESSGKSAVIKFLDYVYYFFAKLWHKMFAYQFIVVGKIKSLDNVHGEGKLN